jgi:hypothetical protein
LDVLSAGLRLSLDDPEELRQQLEHLDSIELVDEEICTSCRRG